MRRLVLPALLAVVVASLGVAPSYAAPRVATHPIQRALYRYGDAARGDRWTGSDATYSVPLPDGRTLWLWGDTFLGTVNRDRSRDMQGFIHNAWTVQERDGRFGRTLYRDAGLFGAPRAWANHEPDANVWYWPGDATVVGNTVEHLLFKVTGAGPAFGVVGVDVATYALPSLALLRVDPLPGAFTAVAGGGQTAFGVGVLEDGDYTYVYGCEEWLLDKHLHVARVRRGASLRTAWEYWDGAAWSSVAPSSRRVLSRVANELSVVRTARGYRLVTQDVGILPEVYAYTAARPEGPWGQRTLLYRTPEDQARLVTYNDKEHPQLCRRDRIVVSYKVNSGSGYELYTNVDNYRPCFVEIRLQ